MNIMTIIIALAVVVVAIVWLVSRRSGSSAQPKRSVKHAAASLADRSTTQWRAVKIAPGLMSCKQAEKLAGQVFLASESPQLPLEGCGEDNCRCKYVHLDDRRSGGDRRIELGDLGAFLPVTQTERRQVRGRRTGDLAPG